MTSYRESQAKRQRFVHRPDTSEEAARFAQRCVCGSLIVFYEGPKDSDYGYGCEALGKPSSSFEVCGGEL